MALRFDDIVIGAGSSGAVLAARLSEDPSRRVLLLEAGPHWAHFHELPAPLRDARVPVLSGFNWPDTACHEQPNQTRWAPGRVAGGSSAVNGAVALRPLPQDFERWAAVAGPLWQWTQVLPALRRLENDLDFRNGELHGSTGPIPIRRGAAHGLSPLQRAFAQACADAGMATLDDLNGHPAAGVGRLPMNSIDGDRISAAVGYLMPAHARANLEVRGEHLVHRIVFNGRHAVGVEVSHRGETAVLHADRITLCAGALNTPAVLLRSGVGAAAHCSDLGVDVVADLPGVGENLMDHPAVLLWMLPNEGSSHAEEAHPVHQVMARLTQPALNLVALGGVPTEINPMLAALLKVRRANAVSVVLGQPSSRGRVTLQDAKPSSAARIQWQCNAADDVDHLMGGVRTAWELVRHPAMAALTGSIHFWRDALVGNDQLLRTAVLRTVSPTCHVAGTARMGSGHDPLAVVDERCRVHGVENLRVVDASVMPALPSTPTNLCCIMLGERVAEWMRH